MREPAGGSRLAVPHLQVRTHPSLHERLVLALVLPELGLQVVAVVGLVGLVVVRVGIRLVRLRNRELALRLELGLGLKLRQLQVVLSLFERLIHVLLD